MFDLENDTLSVEVNTDDLDSFSELFHKGTTESLEKEKTETESVPDDEETSVVEKNETETEETSEEISEESDETEETPKEEEKAKKPNRYQERIKQLIDQRKEVEQREAELKRQIEELTAAKQSDSIPPKTNETQKQAVEYPDANATNEDGSLKYPLGEIDPAYLRDLNRVIIEEEYRVKREQEQKEQETRQIEEARAELQNKWTEKLETVEEKYEDFYDKTIELESSFEGIDPVYGDYLVQTIKSLDYGPDVLYYLANNLEEAKEFVESGPLLATLKLGELNALFKGEKRKEVKVSKAPPPPQVLAKGTNVRKVVSPDTDDLDAFSDVFFKNKKR